MSSRPHSVNKQGSRQQTSSTCVVFSACMKNTEPPPLSVKLSPAHTSFALFLHSTVWVQVHERVKIVAELSAGLQVVVVAPTESY